MARRFPNPETIADLRARLADTEAALAAIRSGAADALVDGAGAVRPLSGSERSYLTFFHAMGEGGVTLDGVGNILNGNPRFLAMLGRPVEALHGTPFLACVRAEDRERVAALLATGGAGACEASLAGALGTLPVRISHEPVLLGDQHYACLVLTDLSQHAAAEAELRIAAIAFESQDGILVTDDRGRIVRVNSAFARRSEYTPEELIGRTPSVLKSGRHSPAFYEALWRELGQRGYWQGEIWNKAKSGKITPEWLTVSAVLSPAGCVTHYVATYSEIQHNREAQAEIYRLAYYDPLTHLPNRRLLNDRLAHALAASARNHRPGALLFLDLDNFKFLNDSLGHDVGDHLLAETGRRLRNTLREVDTVARLGGDEFVVILEDLEPNAARASLQARQVGDKLREALTQPVEIGAQAVECAISIGVTLFDGHNVPIPALMKRADLALYRAKTSGRNTTRFFDTALQSALDQRSAIENDLRDAVARNELELYYQPQLDGQLNVVGAEALLRWNHPQLGLVMPDRFIPVAEESGLIVTLGEWVTEAACEQLQSWSDPGPLQSMRIAINVSARQLRAPRFAERLTGALERRGADPRRLTLELTESVVLHNLTEVFEQMSELKARGIGFALDDFGTGSSCLSYLSRLPLDQLKIDRSFVLNLPQNRNDAIIAQTIITMATSLGLGVVAEGVENHAQLRFLEAHDCGAYQGYLFGPPLPASEFEQLLAHGARLTRGAAA